MMRVNELSEQPSQALYRVRPPGINPPAIKLRRLKTGWNALCLDQQSPRMVSSPLRSIHRRAVSHRDDVWPGSSDLITLSKLITLHWNWFVV